MAERFHDVMLQFDRRFESATAAQGRPFVIDAVAWLQWLKVEPRLQVALRQLERDRPLFEAELQQLAQRTLQKLVSLRRELVERLPEAKDHPKHDALARFDRLADRLSVTLPLQWGHDSTGVTAIGELLLERFNQAIEQEHSSDGATTHRADIEREILRQGHLDFERALRSTLETHRQHFRAFVLRFAAAPFSTLAQLEHHLFVELTGDSALSNELFAAETAVSSSRFETWVASVRAASRRLFHQLRQLLDASADLRALSERYVLRCEQFEKAELRKLGATKTSGDQSLANHLARYLFDHGHDLAQISVEARAVKGDRRDDLIAAAWGLRLRDAANACLLIAVLDGPLYLVAPQQELIALVVDLRAKESAEPPLPLDLTSVKSPSAEPKPASKKSRGGERTTLAQ